MLGRTIQDRLLAEPDRIASRFVSGKGEFSLTQRALCGMASDAARRISALGLPPQTSTGSLPAAGVQRSPGC